jgi:TMEM175 potassium channel family protein
VALYGCILLGAAVAYYILTRALIALHGRDSTLATALGKDIKGKVSIVIYVAAILAAFISPWISCGSYVFVAVMWLVPDRRIERIMTR